MAFTVPLAALVEVSAIGDGVALTVAACVGKFLSGAWAAPIRAKEGGCARRPFWVAFLQVGCAMIGRGELGFVLAKEALTAAREQVALRVGWPAGCAAATTTSVSAE